ncbi:MAG: universal stress protein UspA [Burkholderiales bacterium PBB3]|nr:MAG: universal stress protein UspA [Burkholderiales bacterium PBB3]
MKILLAVDGSAYSKKMLAYLATHNGMFSATHDYTVFTAQAALPTRARAAVGKEVVNSYYADESEKVIAPVTKFLLRHGINAKSSWKVGQAGALIAKLAEDGEFDMVVMGSHGQGAWANLVMGSVATQVLAHCKVPVLMVR